MYTSRPANINVLKQVSVVNYPLYNNGIPAFMIVVVSMI